MYLFGLAFLAGLLTILAPCILPLLPIILGTSGGRSKYRPFMIILGFLVSFSFIGALLATFGSFFGISGEALRVVAIVMLTIFGLLLTFKNVFNKIVGWLEPWLAKASQSIAGDSALKSDATSGFLVGISLGIVWTPCAGPVLGTILTLASSQKNPFITAMLLFAYALGAGIPMFFISYGGQKLQAKFKKLGQYERPISLFFGIMILATALAIATGYDRVLQTKLAFVFPTITFGNNLKSTPASNNESIKSENGKLPILFGSMPEFTGITAWLNSPPLEQKNLRGKVVLIDFWTYSCINCIRTLPYITSLDSKYKDSSLVIVGVHTPEFAFEKNVKNVVRELKRYSINYPVALDNDFGTWNAYGNKYWPAKYLFDAEGRLRYVHFGEGNYNETEEAIKSLLLEMKPDQNMSVINSSDGNKPITKVDFSKIKTPETYVGYARQENLVNDYEVKKEIVKNYQNSNSVGKLRLNDWLVLGNWMFKKEYGLAGIGASLQYYYSASNLNLVMGSATGKDSLVEVLLDAKPVDEKFFGKDLVVINNKTYLKVSEERLYSIIDAMGNYGEHLLELRFDDGNVEVYAFTFG